MASILEQPILGLGTEFPDHVFILKHAPTGRYGCYCHEGIHGLAVFSDEAHALNFGSAIDISNLEICMVSFDESRDVAKGRPLPVVAVMLLDQLDAPVIHFVR
ncbi:MAG: hypothetical protein JST35_02805 [Armatimonadetes bacterium]|nr:hypothetical protein [Armatimonadota bacterium]